MVCPCRLAYEPIVLCSQHRAYLEIVAIVEQYMKEHPQEWERSMAGHHLDSAL